MKTTVSYRCAHFYSIAITLPNSIESWNDIAAIERRVAQRFQAFKGFEDVSVNTFNYRVTVSFETSSKLAKHEINYITTAITEILQDTGNQEGVAQ